MKLNVKLVKTGREGIREEKRDEEKGTGEKITQISIFLTMARS
jgi:hypothetical protein